MEKIKYCLKDQIFQLLLVSMMIRALPIYSPTIFRHVRTTMRIVYAHSQFGNDYMSHALSFGVEDIDRVMNSLTLVSQWVLIEFQLNT